MPVILDRMVMPRSRSRSLESITRSMTASFSRKMPLCLSMASTSVVLPWSTWAMMAMLRMVELVELFVMNYVNWVKARSDPRRVKSGYDCSAPDQQQCARQQRYRGVKLDCPAEALLVDYEY